MSFEGASALAVNVRKRFGRTRALEGVSLNAHPGVTGLLGPNGAGKTTLLRLLATVISPDAGRLQLLGRDPMDETERTAIRQQLGYLPQEVSFHPNFTVFEFVDYVAILKEHTDRRARHREVCRVLEILNLKAFAGVQIRALSSGMRQRVALAQALLGDPKLLVLDEPTTGLDPEQRLHLCDVISRLGPDRTVVVGTHQIELIGALCDRVVVIRAGVSLWHGTPQQLADLARGKVWVSNGRSETARRSRRTSDRHYRNIGDPPDNAQLVEPTIEEGYLLLLGDRAREGTPWP
jgi:ABC-2 type transport system ATP-binding protein